MEENRERSIENKDSVSEAVTNEAAEELSAPAVETDAQSAAQYGLPEGHAEIGELKERIEQRKRYKKRRQRRFRAWVYVTAFLLTFGAFGFFFSISGFFTIDSIEVDGNSHYTYEEILNIAHASAGRNIIYDSHRSEMTDYLEQNPYIKKAEVTRRLPSTLVIRVWERSEMMAFKYDDDYLVMDGEGILLKKTGNAPKVTLAEGVVVNKIKLGEKVGTVDRDRTNKIIKLIGSMSDADLYFVRLDASDLKEVRAYVYESLVVKTDYDSLLTNIENGHLHQILEHLFDEGIKRGTITFEDDGSASFMPVI